MGGAECCFAVLQGQMVVKWLAACLRACLDRPCPPHLPTHPSIAAGSTPGRGTPGGRATPSRSTPGPQPPLNPSEQVMAFRLHEFDEGRGIASGARSSLSTACCSPSRASSFCPSSLCPAIGLFVVVCRWWAVLGLVRQAVAVPAAGAFISCPHSSRPALLPLPLAVQWCPSALPTTRRSLSCCA